MDSPVIKIETPLTPSELMDKLSRITITEISQIRNSPYACYYGELKPYSFDIKNVRFSPVNTFPNIIGIIEEGINSTTINIKLDIYEQYQITRYMYYSTLLPIGLIVMLLSFLVLGGTEYQIHGFVFSGIYILLTFLSSMLTKSYLVKSKKKELKTLTDQLNGKLSFK